jgi:hypothetical protein
MSSIIALTLTAIAAASVASLAIPRWVDYLEHQRTLRSRKASADAKLRLAYRGTIIEDRYGLT